METPLLYQVMVGRHPYWEPVESKLACMAVRMAAIADFGVDAVSVREIKRNGDKRSEVKWECLEKSGTAQ